MLEAAGKWGGVTSPRPQRRDAREHRALQGRSAGAEDRLPGAVAPCRGLGGGGSLCLPHGAAVRISDGNGERALGLSAAGLSGSPF